MSPETSEYGSMTCWNCDETVDHTRDALIWLPSGRQSVLTLCYPCYASIYVPLAPQAMDLRPKDLRGGTVLVVDDDPSMQSVLTVWLQGEGFTVQTASNGAEALERIRDHVPEVIVLDLRMPVMSGAEFLETWRRTMQVPSIPVVAISAHHRNLSTEDLGVRAFLAKPFSLTDLTNIILDAVA
jgi:CheY-like chemotaxis protein